MACIVAIIYDSIHNSVFHSQVLAPLQKVYPTDQIHLISFESTTNIVTPHVDGVTFHIRKRCAYMGRWSLWPAIIQTRYLLGKFKLSPSTIIARGPYAGYIARTVSSKHTKLIVQARGLAAEEYHYTQKKRSWWHRFRYRQLKRLEHSVFRCKDTNVTFQAVSNTLKQYMTEHFDTPEDKITLAKHDIPEPIDAHTKKRYRTIVRNKLNIKKDRYVYCYSGSYKPWQKPELIVQFFKKQYESNPSAYLAIYTQDLTPFATLLQTTPIPQSAYCVITVKPQELLHYLSAADAGLLFRDTDIINTVSRPTKALEYQAAGLSIIHNGTVDYLNHMNGAERIKTATF